MCKNRCFAIVAFLLTAAVSVFAAGQIRAAETSDKITAKEKEQKLIAVLQSDAAPQEKAIACKRLAVYGTKDAVPALAALLSNEQLASWARIALEAIPDPAGDALDEVWQREWEENLVKQIEHDDDIDFLSQPIRLRPVRDPEGEGNGVGNRHN
jgi:hypothetical protein